MVKYCAVYGCSNSNYKGKQISMFAFPRDPLLRKTWEMKTRRKNFQSTEFSYICSEHFKVTDYSQHSSKKILKAKAVPSVFEWTENPSHKKICGNISDSSETDTASEGEDSANHVFDPVRNELSVSEQFGLRFLNSHPNERLFKFYTGFGNSEVFSTVLGIILPNLDRKHLKDYDFRKLSDCCSGEKIDSEEDEEVANNSAAGNSNYEHKLSVGDEFLLVLMRLRLGLFYEDLAVRFSITLSSVKQIIYSWLNLMYCRLGIISNFPHRDEIISAMKPEFRKNHPTTMVIIDCIEIRTQTLQSLKRMSRYKSTNTLKGLIAVDSTGGIMFVSRLYTDSISDKDLCRRSGFFDLLTQKRANGELHEGDVVMADKSFTIAEELERIGLQLTSPPFLGQSTQFSEHEVITARTTARHRIHVERAIEKIRRFHIFDRKIPVTMMGRINQIWLVCCMLSNFQDSILK